MEMGIPWSSVSKMSSTSGSAKIESGERLHHFQKSSWLGVKSVHTRFRTAVR